MSTKTELLKIRGEPENKSLTGSRLDPKKATPAPMINPHVEQALQIQRAFTSPTPVAPQTVYVPVAQTSSFIIPYTSAAIMIGSGSIYGLSVDAPDGFMSHTVTIDRSGTTLVSLQVEATDEAHRKFHTKENSSTWLSNDISVSLNEILSVKGGLPGVNYTLYIKYTQ